LNYLRPREVSMSYAIIKTGGKQYTVKAGQYYEFNRMSVDVGAEVVFDDVLFVSDSSGTHVGQPVLGATTVKGKVLSHYRGEKINIIKFRRRQDSQTRIGHRDDLTRVEITEIICKEK